MKFLKLFLQVLFRVLKLHDPLQRLLIIVTLVAVVEAPFALPGVFKMAYGMYYAWKNNLPPTSASAPAPAPTVADVPVVGMVGPRAGTTRRPH